MEDQEYFANRIVYVRQPLTQNVAHDGGNDGTLIPSNGKRDNSLGNAVENPNFNGQGTLPQTSETRPNVGDNAQTPRMVTERERILVARTQRQLGIIAELRLKLESQYNLTQDLLDESMEAHRAITFYGNLVHHAVNFYNQQYMSRLYAKLKRAGPNTRILKFGMAVPPQFWQYVDVPNVMTFSERRFSRTVHQRTAVWIRKSKKPGKLSNLNVRYQFSKSQNGRKLF